MHLLLVDDEPNMLLVLRDLFAEERYAICSASSVQEAQAQLTAVQPEVVVCDLRLGSESGLSLLEFNRSLSRPARFVMLTAHGDVDTAVRALKLGAFDFLLKPAEDQRLLNTVRLAFSDFAKDQQLDYLEAEVGRLSGGLDLIGASPNICLLREQIERLSKTATAVLVAGESGTGKEVVARKLHALSSRSKAPFVVVNCAALNPSLLHSELFGHERGAFPGADARRRGKLELADGGSLFLDEVGELPLELQGKLLRVLEDGKIERAGSERALIVDVRVIAATNRDLEAAIEANEFRLDLFHRLNTVTLKILPLSERLEDIVPLADHFLSQLRVLHGRPALRLTDLAYSDLKRYHWPGNVRELRNVLERAVVMTVGDEIEPQALALAFDENLSSASAGLQDSLKSKEREIILGALQRNNWVQARAAKELGLNRSHLHYKIKRLGIVLPG